MSDSKDRKKIREKINKIIHNPFVWGGIIVTVITLAIVAFVLYGLWQDAHDEQISVTNFNVYIDNIPKDVQTDIAKKIFQIAKLNSPETNVEDIAVSVASIRDGTVDNQYNFKKNNYYGNFIVDIPNIKQNYRVDYSWDAGQDLNVKVTTKCLTPDEYVYPFYLCLNLDDDTSRPYLGYLNNILPYSGYVESGAAMYVRGIERTTGGDPFVRIQINSCGDNIIMDSGLEQMKSYITEYGLDPNNYTLKIADLCDGGM